MLIYHYDLVSGLFLGAAAADPDPLELERERTRVFATASAGAHAAYAAALGDDAPLSEARAALELALRAAQEQADAVQPTVFLIPAGATDKAPPACAEDEFVRWVEGDWTVEAPAPEPEPEPEPEPTEAELAAAARRRRDAEIAGTRWLIDRDEDEAALELPATLTPAQVIAVRRHVQDLRDVPAQPNFPNEIQWPVLPADIINQENN